MPLSKDAALYGAPRPKKSSAKEISSSSTLAFSSQLSSLIASSSKPDSKASSGGRARSSQKKDDIFSVHNKGSKKRALKDLDDVDFTEQKHATSGFGERLSESEQKRQRRIMEEKARRYAALKRGDIEDADEKYGVDFDRKWVEAQERGEKEASDQSSDDDDYSGGEAEDLVEYVDEFGRTRKGTRAEAAREERNKKRAATLAAEEPDRFTARPSMPSNIIFGDTIQSAAFNPEESIAAQMAEIAAKRDRGDTPPADTHFDANAEIRRKGTGFYTFSGEQEERKKQMEALEKERAETERKRSQFRDRKEERRKEVEERRKAIRQKRAKGEADKFLDGLSKEWGGDEEDRDEKNDAAKD